MTCLTYAKNFCETVLFANSTSLIYNIDRTEEIFDDVNESPWQMLSWTRIKNYTNSRNNGMHFCIVKNKASQFTVNEKKLL